MKHCKKLLAVLLAAVLILTALTACNGNVNIGEGEMNAKTALVETTLIEVFNRTLGLNKSNELRNDAANMLSRIGSGGQITGKASETSVGLLNVKVVAIPNSFNMAWSMEAAQVNEGLSDEGRASLDQVGEQLKSMETVQAALSKIRKIGVAAKELDGKIYLAVAFEVG